MHRKQAAPRHILTHKSVCLVCGLLGMYNMSIYIAMMLYVHYTASPLLDDSDAKKLLSRVEKCLFIVFM